MEIVQKRQEAKNEKQLFGLKKQATQNLKQVFRMGFFYSVVRQFHFT